ncbi:MAG: type IV toxin-antitoxin system AbiEi family antitoxin domain-containing protein [Muribaculaceae bacterium]|nr:type IV toxin-antitoxin system AbiEi family antitoxin domain-containing protein [Muribaculaceae bacterium]
MGERQGISISENVVRERIMSLEKGAIFFPSDFVEIASPEAIRQMLSRMVKKAEIIRISRGIYYVPRSNKALGLECIPPSTEDIAQRIAERDRVRIIPTGDQALNQLGLSSQIPANAVYITNGARKKIKLTNGRNIIFRESNELRQFEFVSNLMMLAVSAIRSIGEENITEDIVDRIKAIVRNVSPDIYKHDLRLAPLWVRKKLEE